MDDKSKTLIASIEEAIKALAQETDEAKISSVFLSFMDGMRRFHNYSFYNQILIYLQRPSATQVAGFVDWQKKFSRTVNKGEKGIAILAPILAKYAVQRKSTQEDAEVISSETENLYVNRCIGFRVVYVFDISQTEGKPLPEEPNWHDTGKDPIIEAALKTFAQRKGIRVEEAVYLFGADGLSKGGLIKILPEAGTRTLVHELAHELLHWKYPDLKLPAKIEEIVADSTAYVVANYFHLTQDQIASPNYLALKNASSEDILSCMNRIRSASKEIIEAVEAIKGLHVPEGAG